MIKSKKSLWLSWFVCSKRYTMACWSIENFRNKCNEIYELDPVHFLSEPGLAWQACLKKTQVELELLANNNMLLMVEKVELDYVKQYIDMLKQTINI